MEDVSAFGFQIRLIASTTFPQGFDISQFADDSDPFDIPAVAIGDAAMGLNGDLITWSKANPLKTTIGVIAGSADDSNMSVIYEANRVGKGKISARDIITLVGIYPTGRVITLGPGKMLEGMPGFSVASAGRLKTKVFNFSFENIVSVGPS